MTAEKEIFRESEEDEGYIVWMMVLFKRLNETDSQRMPSGVFVPGFRTCSDGNGVAIRRLRSSDTQGLPHRDAISWSRM